MRELVSVIRGFRRDYFIRFGGGQIMTYFGLGRHIAKSVAQESSEAKGVLVYMPQTEFDRYKRMRMTKEAENEIERDCKE